MNEIYLLIVTSEMLGQRANAISVAEGIKSQLGNDNISTIHPGTYIIASQEVARQFWDKLDRHHDAHVIGRIFVRIPAEAISISELKTSENFLTTQGVQTSHTF